MIKLLSTEHPPHPEAEDHLLSFIEPVFTDSDNEMLRALPTESEIKKVIHASNQDASPGSDGISSLFYLLSWDIIKDMLLKVICEIHLGHTPTESQCLSVMVFAIDVRRLEIFFGKTVMNSPSVCYASYRLAF